MIWIGLFACMVISFTFSGIEAGVLSVNRVRLRHHARRGEAAAMQLDGLLMRMERLMITVVLVNNAANIVGISLLFYSLSALLGSGWAAVATLLVALPVMVVVLEFLPRAIFRRFPYRTLAVFARILTVAHWICGPVVATGAWLLRPLLERRPTRDRTIVGKDDIRRITSDSVSRGQISEMGRAIIEHVMEFRGLHAGEMMTPFRDTSTVKPETGVPEILERARQTGADRFPVINADGRCEGIVRVFDLLRDGVTSGRAQSYARRVIAFSPDADAMDVLKKLRAARISLGLVTDADGIPVGIVSTDVLVSRLLGGQK